MTAIIDQPILPGLLYRYRPITDETIAREIQALTENYLWFSKYRALNDPMEGFYGATVKVKKNARYASIVREILNEKREIGICCFSDTKDSELMWTHYASNYQGLCIGYRPSGLVTALPDESHVVRLAYGRKPPVVGVRDVNDAKLAAQRILSHKKESWSYEREWRVLGPIGRTRLTKACASEVYFGFRMQSQHRECIESALSILGFRMSTMRVSQYNHRFTEIAQKAGIGRSRTI